MSADPFNSRNLSKRELYYKARFLFRKNQQQANIYQDINCNQKDNIFYQNNEQYILEALKKKKINNKNLSFEKYFKTSAGNTSRKQNRNLMTKSAMFQHKQQNYVTDQNNQHKFILQNHQQQQQQQSQYQQNKNRSFSVDHHSKSQQQGVQQIKQNRVLTPHVPSVNFGKMASRKPFMERNTAQDERRFNNFEEFRGVNSEVTNLEKRPERDWKIFNVPMQDQYYEQANRQYLKTVYQDKLKCTFNFDREQHQNSKRCDFGQTQYKSEPDPTKVLTALDKILPRTLKNGLRMDIMTGRDSPSVFGLKLFKESQKEFYQQSRKQPIKRAKRLYSHQ